MVFITDNRKKVRRIRDGGGWFALAIAALSTLGMFSGCQEEIDIAEFAEEYGDYVPELRIEAILDVVEPWNSIVRVDRTILVTDTTIFNGRDDDGDGAVDEFDEILAQIHDATVTVILWDLTIGDSALGFAWNPEADSFTVAAGPPMGFNHGPGEERVEVVTYGAYKPTAVHDTIDIDHKYEFRITTDEHLITGTVHPLPPPVFDIDPLLAVGDTLLVVPGGLGQLTWTTVRDATVYWVLIEAVLGPDSLRTIISHPSAPVEQRVDGSWIGLEPLSMFPPGLYRLTVTVPSRAYGAYVFSQLPMRDEQVSNLRDENGEVVLGIAGSAASASQYVRILGFDF